MKTALKQTEEDLETGLPFTNVGIPLLHCLLVQQAEELTSHSVNAETQKLSLNSADFQTAIV